MITIKIHQYFYSIVIEFSRLILTSRLTVDSFSLVDIALRRRSIKTSWLSKGLILLFELVIPLMQLCVNNFLLLWKEQKSLYIEM